MIALNIFFANVKIHLTCGKFWYRMSRKNGHTIKIWSARDLSSLQSDKSSALQSCYTFS